MPLQLSDLKTKTRKIAVEFDGDTVNIEYWTQKFNPSYQDSIKSGKKTKGLSESDSWASLLEIVKSWDLVDGDKPFPLNKESLAIVGNRLLMAIWVAIQADALPNAMSGGNSAAGSFQKGS
jgi:hypothetical protein